MDVVLDRSPPLPGIARIDAAKLRQTLINVLGNAIKCMDPGGVTVRLTTENGGRSRLTLQERILQPFAQAGALATGGTGWDWPSHGNTSH